MKTASAGREGTGLSFERRLPIPFGLASPFGLGLMFVTGPHPSLPQITAQVIDGGVDCIQWRVKSLLEEDALPEAMWRALGQAKNSKGLGARLFVNGLDFQKMEGHAHGIHLPENAPPVREFRERIGNKAWIGRSVHSREAAQNAEMEGADYIIAGTIFESHSHPQGTPAGIEFLRSVCEAVAIPVLAIGGIELGHVQECIQAGAAGIALRSSLLYAKHPDRAARGYRQALEAASG